MAYRIELPQITGQTEKEQISQLHRYLYRQAEYLQWALNNLESGKTETNNATQKATDTFVSIMGLIKDSDDIFDAYAAKLGDYVVEAGASGGWTYKKWSKGTYEMFGWFSVTPTSSEKGESLYKTNAMQITTPFAILQDAVITGMSDSDAWITGAYAGTNKISIKIISDEPISTTEGAGVHLHVVGTYPINTED